MRRLIGRVLPVVLLAATLLALPSAAGAQNAGQGGVRQQSRALTTGDVISQLGISVADSSAEFEVGANFTGTLREPAKLELLGIRGLHKGARVSAVRISMEKVRVEADEIEPKPARAAATLRIDAHGTLSLPGTGN